MIFRINKKVICSVVLLLSVFLLSHTTINVSSVFSQQNDVRLPIVMYHQLTKNKNNAGKYVLTLEQFENDLIYLKANGYKSITVQQLIYFYEGRADLPEKPVMITFDDGCETVYAYALSLLEKYGFNAVCFVIGSVTDKYTELNDHNLSYSNLNWLQAKELYDGGVIDIQSHTYNLHDNTKGRSGLKKLKNETFEEYREFLTADMSKMKEKMLENIGSEPVSVAYPFGSYSEETIIIMKEIGIKAAFNCEEKVNIIKKSEPEQLLRLGRFNRPSGISSENFFGKWE